jgi:hypothetical protein
MAAAMPWADTITGLQIRLIVTMALPHVSNPITVFKGLSYTGKLAYINSNAKGFPCAF